MDREVYQQLILLVLARKPARVGFAGSDYYRDVAHLLCGRIALLATAVLDLLARLNFCVGLNFAVQRPEPRQHCAQMRMCGVPAILLELDRPSRRLTAY